MNNSIIKTFISMGDITIGKRVLKPRSDLTPIELWNIYKFIEACKFNRDIDQLWNHAVELGIDRHFEWIE